MDESKERELEGVNVTESVVTVNSVVTTTETVIKKVVTGCEVEESRERVGVSEKELAEKDGGPCEVGDVMVEILGAEVIVDGVRRESGEMGGDELGHRNGDFGTINDDGEVCGGRGVKHAINCEDEGLDTLPDDSGLCAEGNVASQLRDQFVGGDDTSLANFASQDCNICDVDNEKTIEVAVEGDIVRQSGDAGEKKDVELPNNVPELYQDSNTHIVEGKSNDIGNIVLDMHTITSTSDEKMDLDDEESLETLKRTREQDSQNEGDHQAGLEAGAHGHTTVLEDETVNGGISSVGASITRAKRTSLGCSIDVNVFGETDPEKPIILESNYDSSDLHTQIDRIDHMDGANESIPVPEPDTPINGPQFIEDEKSNDTSLPARVGSENGTVDDMKVHRTDMEIDAASGSVIHSENQLVDMNENDEDIENNVILSSLSKALVVESLFIEMNIDASDPVSLKQGMVCEAPHDDLKSNSETQELGADDNTKESDHIESVTMVQQYVEAVGKIENIVEHLSTCSPVLDATDDSGAGGVIQEPDCKANAFHVECLDSHTTDGVAEIGPHMENVQKLQEVMYSELVSVDYASPNENHNAKVLQPVRLDAGGDEKAVLKVLDEQVSLINALTNEEDKTIKLAGSLIPSIENVTEVGLNMDAARGVQVLSTDPVVSMDNSNMEGIEEVQVEAVSAEEAVYMNNEAPDEDETPKQHNRIPSATEGTHGEKCRLDKNVIVGPFVVETQGSGDSVVGREYVDMDSGPMHDGIGNSDSHALEMPHSPYNPLDERLVVEAADHDAKTDSDMEDAQDKGEPDNAQQAEEQVSLINALTNEDKTIELAGSSIPSIENVTEVGSNTEAAREVQQVFSIDPVVSMDNNSNMEGMEEVQEEAVSTEEAVYMNNEAPDEDETPKQHNRIPSATEGAHGETCRLDEDVIVGPFVVETEDSSDTVVGREYVDMDSGPMHDGIESLDSHALKMPHSPYDPLDERLVVEAADHDAKTYSDMEDAQDKGEPDNSQQAEDQEFDEEHVPSSAKSRNKEKNISAYTKSESLLKDHRVSYQLPLEIQGEFSVTNLVWGKVKSHPWWPGQIFHPSDSSEKAMKYFRKDCYLVAYFGDRTFAWNEASVLKPFRNHFSVAERQNKTEAFQNAVSCALAEVSRRMELGLACSCVSQQAYEKIRYQMVENTGIRKEPSKRVGADRCSGLEYFQPDKLVEYIRSLAIFPTGSVDRLELVIAKAHLVAFLRLKGIDCLSDYQYYEGISGEVEHEDSATRFDSKTTLKGSKRKHNLKDIVYQRREKSMSELMGETMYYLDSEFDSHEEDDNMLTSPSIKRKASGFNDFTSQPATKTISVAKVSNKASHTPQQSFKVGECIQRVASQLTGSSLLLKSGSDGGGSEHLGDAVDEVVEASDDSPTEMSPSPSHESSLDEMLSQLHLFAQDPMKGYNFLGEIVGFFVEFRNLAVSNQRQRMRRGPGKKRKSSTPVVGTPETFEFDDRNDSYWRDMVVQNNAEAKPSRRGRKRKDEQGLSVDSEKPSQSKPRKSSRKQYFHGSLGSTVETSSGDKEKQKQLPTELLLNFTGMGTIPSEINLNKMFRCFGPLKESETEIDLQSSRARVVFKKRSDAEVAYSSAAMFNIFGSTLVNYQLNYTPSGSFKTCPLELMDSQEKAA
ncbi:uncharacterized protein LOC141600079 [Silene latifolia]|uniref:uncharacterized protein LOC141600079 n=1 Tax=Silene latifolia TaxID=37657 RepID=UPI003D7783BA